MHGLINRTIQGFVCDTYGHEVWGDIAGAAGLSFTAFEPMLVYPGEMTDRLLAAAERRLGRPLNTILEDLGTYLISNSRDGEARRLLRFSGQTFLDFLLSLGDLPDRVRLAVPELMFPEIQVDHRKWDRVVLNCGPGLAGFNHVLGGVVRAMADDYGALVTIESADGGNLVEVTLHGRAISGGQEFRLSQALRP